MKLLFRSPTLLLSKISGKHNKTRLTSSFSVFFFQIARPSSCLLPASVHSRSFREPYARSDHRRVRKSFVGSLPFSSFPHRRSNRCAMTRDDEYDSCGPPGSIQHLLSISLRACYIMTPFVQSIYKTIDRHTAKEKADKSAFTIADGMVQHLLTNILYEGMFGDIVGEEDVDICLNDDNPNVDGLVIPVQHRELLSETLRNLSVLKDQLTTKYPELTVFIDPIDGTKEFVSGKGEQCSICIGFSSAGSPVGGLVFRPLSSPVTYAMGCKRENFIASHKLQDEDGTPGLLTSNGSISPFLTALMDRAQYNRIPAGGAGNKMLRLLENDNLIYILDRGVSRWDTCAASAVIEAHGGYVGKLSSFINRKTDDYTYMNTASNADFEQGGAKLTPYNSSDKGNEAMKCGHTMAMAVDEVKPYANLCGLVAIGPKWNNDASKTKVLDIVQKTAKIIRPSYD